MDRGNLQRLHRAKIRRRQRSRFFLAFSLRQVNEESLRARSAEARVLPTKLTSIGPLSPCPSLHCQWLLWLRAFARASPVRTHKRSIRVIGCLRIIFVFDGIDGSSTFKRIQGIGIVSTRESKSNFADVSLTVLLEQGSLQDVQTSIRNSRRPHCRRCRMGACATSRRGFH